MGSAGGVATDVAMSGDATIVASGALTIANLAVTNAKIANATIDLTTKVTGTLPEANGGTNNTTFTAGSVIFAGAGLLTENNAQFFWDNATARLFMGANASIGGSNAGVQYSDATTANRGQFKAHSYFNGASVAGVSTLTSRSGVVGTNAAVVAGQDYSKWTAQAGATTPGSAPISGTWSFKANTVNALTVTSDFHLQLTNLAGTLGDRLYLTSEGLLQLSGYTTGIAHLDVTGNLTSSAVSLTADVSGILPVANGGTNSNSALANNRVMVSSGGAIVEAAAITGNRALASNASGIPVASATTDTELGFVSGVTSSIQTQLNGKQSTALTTNHILVGSAGVATDVAMSGDATIVSSGALTIANLAVTNAKIANATIDLTTKVTGILPLANGGTNNSSWTANSIPFVNSAGTALAEDNAAITWDDTLKNLTVNGHVISSSSSVDAGNIDMQFSSSSNTTVNGSNTTIGMQGNTTALVQVGALNDKAVGGMIQTITRGDGTDDGELDTLVANNSLIFHNSGAAGITDKTYGNLNIFFLQKGNSDNNL